MRQETQSILLSAGQTSSGSTDRGFTWPVISHWQSSCFACIRCSCAEFNASFWWWDLKRRIPSGDSDTFCVGVLVSGALSWSTSADHLSCIGIPGAPMYATRSTLDLIGSQTSIGVTLEQLCQITQLSWIRPQIHCINCQSSWQSMRLNLSRVLETFYMLANASSWPETQKKAKSWSLSRFQNVLRKLRKQTSMIRSLYM